MNTSFAGTATRDTHSLPVSDHQSKTFLTLRNLMTSLDPAEIKRVKLHPVKCPKCKADLMIKPTEKVCPVCGYSLKRPSPEVIDELRSLYRQREHYNRALDKILAQLEQEDYGPAPERAPARREQRLYATTLDRVLAQISELLMKQKDYKKWFDGDGKVPLPDWVYEVTGGRPGPGQVE
jgi:uncharacterized Zn finger protein (UPF0148 family)